MAATTRLEISHDLRVMQRIFARWVGRLQSINRWNEEGPEPAICRPHGLKEKHAKH